jgi:hypothetical protein
VDKSEVLQQRKGRRAGAVYRSVKLLNRMVGSQARRSRPDSAAAERGCDGNGRRSNASVHSERPGRRKHCSGNRSHFLGPSAPEESQQPISLDKSDEKICGAPSCTLPRRAAPRRSGSGKLVRDFFMYPLTSDHQSRLRPGRNVLNCSIRAAPGECCAAEFQAGGCSSPAIKRSGSASPHESREMLVYRHKARPARRSAGPANLTTNARMPNVNRPATIRV